MRSHNKRQWIVIVIMDVLLLAELCLAMCLGAGDRAHLSAIFIRTYTPLAVATVVICRYFIRRFGRDQAEGADDGREAAS